MNDILTNDIVLGVQLLAACERDGEADRALEAFARMEREAASQCFLDLFCPLNSILQAFSAHAIELHGARREVLLSPGQALSHCYNRVFVLLKLGERAINASQ